jgi:hypothetical protein
MFLKYGRKMEKGNSLILVGSRKTMTNIKNYD